MLSRTPTSQRAHRQKGVVLILALFIVVLVTTVVVSVSWRFNLSMARNENRWHGALAHSYLTGGEQVARLSLMADKQETQNDHLGEEWAAESGVTFPTDEGWIRGKLEDAHGRINLNLLTGAPPTPPGQGQNNNPQSAAAAATIGSQYTPMQRFFIRFLQTIELEQGPVEMQTAMELTEAIQDWLDPDSNPTGFGGAERNYYQGLDHPYPISNGPMVTVSELMMIKGMTPELFTKLQPYVIALPDTVKMNINTLKPELLRGFNSKDTLLPLEQPEWESLVQHRDSMLPPPPEEGAEATQSPAGGYTDVQQFTGSDAMSFIIATPDMADFPELVHSSEYFLLEGETLVGEQIRRRKSMLLRNNNGVEVIRRTDANF